MGAQAEVGLLGDLVMAPGGQLPQGGEPTAAVAAEVLVQARVGVDAQELADAFDVKTSLSAKVGAGPRWRRRWPTSQSSIRQNTMTMKVVTSMATPKKAGRQPEPGSRFLSDVLADNVRAYRSLRRLSQGELARRMGDARHPWTRATVSDVERANRNVTTDELLALAMILSTPIGGLLDPAGVEGRATAPLDFGGWRPMPVGMASRWVRRITVSREHAVVCGCWPWKSSTPSRAGGRPGGAPRGA
jgi:transcriptional regulator with XRE-family HTH domain